LTHITWKNGQWAGIVTLKTHFISLLRRVAFAKGIFSPLSVGEEVEAVQMAHADECGHEMFVEVSWADRVFSVPLSQLKAIETDKQTQQGIEDWHFWGDMGYQF